MTDTLAELGNEAQAAINDAMASQKAIDDLAGSNDPRIAALERVAQAARDVLAPTDIEGPLVTDAEWETALLALRAAVRDLETT